MTNPFMSEAIKEAYIGINKNHGGPFGAVVVKDNKIVGKGHNRVLINKDSTCHGEIMAIRDACKNLKTFDLTGCSIYSTSEPCPMCLAATLWARIEKIYFGCTINDANHIGFSDEKFYKMLSINVKDLNIKQLNKKECLKLFKDYEKLNRSRY